MGAKLLGRTYRLVRTRSLYLLDTTVLIDVARRKEPATSWLGDTLRRSDQVCVSAVTVAEFFAGVRPAQRIEWQRFIDGLTHWDVTREIAIRAGTRSCQAGQGHPYPGCIDRSNSDRLW